MYECDDKMVSHPSHYQSKNGLEVIDVIEAFTEGLEGIEAADSANIIKYACRWKGKNGVQDLKKILWYTTHLIEHLEKKEVEAFQHRDKTNLYCGDPGFKTPELIWDPKTCTYKNVSHLEVPDYSNKGEN